MTTAYTTSLPGGVLVEVETALELVELTVRTDSDDRGVGFAQLPPARARELARALLAHADALDPDPSMAAIPHGPRR